MPRIYLTIDDGPSETFESLVDFLAERKIPAVFFNRGDAMEARPEAVVYGIQKGFIIGNHAYSHRRFSKLPLEICQEEIKKTERILNDLYRKSGVERPGQYFRFPYMDRGMGPWLIEPENLSPEFEPAHRDLVEKGLGHNLHEIEPAKIEKKKALQEYLAQAGFEKLPMKGITLPWYAQSEMAQAIDSLCTFSTSDWAVSERHKGRHGFDDVDDLKTLIEGDAGLQDESSAHIVLAHDQAEIYGVTCSLIDHFINRGFEFLDFCRN